MSDTNTIWVDADACPKLIKEILYRASMRLKIPLILVANQHLVTPSFHLIKKIQVLPGFDVADNYIVEHCQANDLVITSDIPLADAVIKKGARVLGFRGEQFTEDNIGRRLSTRNLMESLRSSGIQTKGPEPLSQADRQKFAQALEKLC